MLAIAEPIVDPHAESLWIEPWNDRITDELGHDARSPYVERFWLGTLGPSATWLLRAFAYGLESCPDGFELAAGDMARILGLGDRTGRHSPFVRAIGRLCQFELIYVRANTIVARRNVPWLDRRQVIRLPASIQAEHLTWDTADHENSPPRAIRRRAAGLAMGVIRSGGSLADAERSLVRSAFHPSLCHSMSEWAFEQHQIARAHARPTEIVDDPAAG